MATLKELEPQIVAEWDRWSAETGKDNHGIFYAHLGRERPDLLKFRCNGAPDRKIKEILIKAGRLSLG